jgi:hypothetical protein
VDVLESPAIHRGIFHGSGHNFTGGRRCELTVRGVARNWKFRRRRSQSHNDFAFNPSGIGGALMALANTSYVAPYPVRNLRYATSPIIGHTPGSTGSAPAPDFVLFGGTPVSTPPVPQSHIVGYSIPQAMASLTVPVNALPSNTQTLSGVPATFTLSGMGMFPLLILALVLYFIFKGWHVALDNPTQAAARAQLLAQAAAEQGTVPPAAPSLLVLILMTVLLALHFSKKK